MGRIPGRAEEPEQLAGDRLIALVLILSLGAFLLVLGWLLIGR